MEQNIAKWYQSCGVCLATSEQYEQRIESIKNFTSKRSEIPVYSELVKCFMGMHYDIQKLSEFISIFNEMDISFSEECKMEIPLLAGLCIFDFINNGNGEELGVMISLAYERGEQPYVKEIYELIMQILDNSRIGVREVSEGTEVKIATLKKISEEEKADWADGVNYVTAILAEHFKYMKAMNSNMNLLKEQLRKKTEESNLLWWLIANWSEFYNCSYGELSDKQSAVVVPLEVMQCVEFLPGPIAVKKIIQKALSGKNLINEYSVKDYIEATGTEVFNSCDVMDYDLSLCVGFTPILELLQYRSRFSKADDIQTVYRLFEENYDVTFLDKKINVLNFANQLYLECELVNLL